MDQVKIGKFISACRKKLNITQEKLAEELGVSKNAVSKWERGINLPDASLMLKLCQTINISLNELFAGEYLNENRLKEQSEKNLLAILKLNYDKNKKYNYLIKLMSILLIIIFLFLGKTLLIKNGYLPDKTLAYSKVYIANEDNIKGDVDTIKFSKININFDIGANKYGIAVFKDPKKAFKTLKKDYKKGIKLIQKEFKLPPLNNFTYKYYSTYGWQVTTGTKEERDQANFISSFLDIYENSFN